MFNLFKRKVKLNLLPFLRIDFLERSSLQMIKHLYVFLDLKIDVNVYIPVFVL